MKELLKNGQLKLRDVKATELTEDLCLASLASYENMQDNLHAIPDTIFEESYQKIVDMIFHYTPIDKLTDEFLVQMANNLHKIISSNSALQYDNVYPEIFNIFVQSVLKIRPDYRVENLLLESKSRYILNTILQCEQAINNIDISELSKLTSEYPDNEKELIRLTCTKDNYKVIHKLLEKDAFIFNMLVLDDDSAEILVESIGTKNMLEIIIKAALNDKNKLDQVWNLPNTPKTAEMLLQLVNHNVECMHYVSEDLDGEYTHIGLTH